MPGLIGIISNNKNSQGNANVVLLNKMVESIRHENYYKIDFYNAPFCSLARAHLNIFNFEPQPIFNKNRDLCIFMDGKIYDYGSEKKKLEDKGYKFLINNDAEFCLSFYEENGVDFVKKLNGAFVIIIVDLRKQTVTIFNDRYGLRPHYYAQTKDKLLFAPEVKAILLDNEIEKKINSEAMIDFFAFGRLLDDKTFFKKIKVLPPASILNYNGNELRISQYWRWEYKPNYNISEKDFTNQLVEKFKKAVEIRTEDDSKYGISLSGGLDSRSVVAAVNREKRKNIISFSFGAKNCDEVNIAKRVAKKAGTKFEFIEIKPETILENAEKTVYLTDGMNYMGVSFALAIHTTIKERVDIILDGFSFDLILGGSYLNEEIVNFHDDESLINYHYRARGLFSDEELNLLFLDGFTQTEKNYLRQTLKKLIEKTITKHLANKSDYFMVEEHGRRLVHMGHVLLRNVLENSIPTYDNDLVDLILTIPPELRINHYIYRKFIIKLSPTLSAIPYNKTMIRPDAPYFLWRLSSIFHFYKTTIREEIAYLFKKQLPIFSERSYVNFAKWLYFNKNWKRYFEKLLLNKGAYLRKYLNQSYIEKLIKTHGAKKGILKRVDNSKKILYLATFEHFLKLSRK